MSKALTLKQPVEALKQILVNAWPENNASVQSRSARN